MTYQNIEKAISHGYELVVRNRVGGEIHALVWRGGVSDSHNFIGKTLDDAMVGLEKYLTRVQFNGEPSR